MQSKIIARLLCLAILSGTVCAQEPQLNNSERLKKKIESVNLIYKSTLRRQYEEYAASLENDIKDLRKVQQELGDTNPEQVKKIDVAIEKLSREQTAAKDKARLLRDETLDDMDSIPLLTQDTRSESVSQLPCNCPQGIGGQTPKENLEIAKNNLPGGVIWCSKKVAGKSSPKVAGQPGPDLLNVQDFAELAAPILWFSPDEPLRAADNQIPEPLPGDKTSGNPVVYYRISEFVLQPNVKDYVFDNTNIDLNSVKGLTLKYYFYYSEDKGFGGHKHDLESVRFDINFSLRYENGKDKLGDKDVDNGQRYYVANISRIIGAAHGVTWYGNQLDIGDKEKDTSLPITLLVEEGKHATSPDRNADGFYSPGYDVNRRYTDAWGVRDLIGSGQLGSAKYEGSMTKPRRPNDMIMVKPSKPDTQGCLLSPYKGEYRGKLEESVRYKLMPAQDFETDSQQEARLKVEDKKPKDDKISGWMENEKFGKLEENGHLIIKKPKNTPGDTAFLRALRRGHGIERNEEFFDAIPIAYRAEGRQHGFTILPPLIRYREPFLGGYLVPKMNFMFPGRRAGAIPGRKGERPIRFSLEAMYTPSASRTFDWYATMGAEWARPDPTLGFAARFIQEGGLRFRFNQGRWLVGGRVGLRVTGFAEARSPRFIFELGTGAF
jgi:hypothetical protein